MSKKKPSKQNKPSQTSPPPFRAPSYSSPFGPKVDVVIPAYNQPILISGVWKMVRQTAGMEHRIILVDDASPEPGVTPAVAEAASNGVTTLLNTQNRGFAATCNRGARTGQSPFICFCNTDVLMEDGWLRTLVQEMEADPTVAVAGPLLLFAPNSQGGMPGMVQSCGFAYNIYRLPFHRLLGWSPSHPKVLAPRKDLQGITGAVMVVRRDFFERAKGFAEEYGSTFEDAELGLAARAMGYKVAYVPGARGVHLVGASAQTAGGFPLQRNAQLFVNRVGHLIHYDEPHLW